MAAWQENTASGTNVGNAIDTVHKDQIIWAHVWVQVCVLVLANILSKMLI